jgi:hypothetical protein
MLDAMIPKKTQFDNEQPHTNYILILLHDIFKKMNPIQMWTFQNVRYLRSVHIVPQVCVYEASILG